MTTSSLSPPPRLRAGIRPGGSIEGYASLFGVEDQGRDIVMPGAFRSSLAQRGAGGIRMLFQHDPAQPVGVWDVIREDARGLFVRGHIIEDAPRAREILTLMQGGAIDGLSIGFRARRAQRDARTGQRRLYDIDLWEISIVTFPMLPGARVSAVKSAAAGSLAGRDQTSIAAGSLAGRDQTSIAAGSLAGRDQTSIAAAPLAGRERLNLAAFPLTRSCPAADTPTPPAAPRTISPACRRPTQERRNARPGEGHFSS